ncbi:MAG TPA: EthD family reductase [Candidatus Sulfotelmatobacter sp.]|nr:EthD family reductase [Candidatus Sulfotelmatobacter sp.]
MIAVTVCYPTGASFDADYYASKHMPMVREGFGKFGLRKDEVRTITGTPTGAPGRYQVVTSLYFDDMGAVGAAFGSPEGRAIVKDIPNFYGGEAEVMIGKIE